ncbi:DUF3618 domain-containing protein [Cellulomonas composti]|uniref:DUF3618 domain-containing protein n=1 Tax=Cellulomonas composti TaxID=266130 RepID=A0A511JD47_9CELL|nr:DUF3618 domain-containing protein [Cellulomonas composti]GEL95927.1 hypothetical protein CCO02nite_25850 [Cellulomonas composti]
MSTHHGANREPGDATVDADTTAALQPPFRTPEMEAIEAHVAATRLALAETIDELTGRLTPRNLVRSARTNVQQLVSDAVSGDADPQARRRARIVLASVVVVVASSVVWNLRARGRD